MNQMDPSPNIDYMCNRVDNIITTCNDNLKGLPQHTTIPKIPKTHLESLCYCSETGWKEDGLKERFQREFIGFPFGGGRDLKMLDIADIRGPCGETDCRIAKDMRYYIEDLAEDDNTMINLDELIGPCGNTSCIFVKHLKDFILHRGMFACDNITHDHNGCSCTEQMKRALSNKDLRCSTCTQECEDLDRIFFGGQDCVQKKEPTTISSKTNTTPSNLQVKAEIHSRSKSSLKAADSQNVQNMFYLTVQTDDKPPVSNSKPSSETKFKYCTPTCPKTDASGKCTKSSCDIKAEADKHISGSQSLKCINAVCPNKEADKQEVYTPSPSDSDVEIDLRELRNPCSVKSCDVADRVVEYIVKGLAKKECTHVNDDSCFCDCSRCKS